MSDLIDRQAAIDILMKEWKAYKDYPYVSHVRHGLEIAIAILENKVPSAQRTGRWIIDRDSTGCMYGRCTSCGMKQYAGRTKFCPNCGARMEVQK